MNNIQEKDISIDLVAARSARGWGELDNLSNEATVLLFQELALAEYDYNQTVTVSSGPGKELHEKGYVNEDGYIMAWIKREAGAALEYLVQNSVANLAPYAEPTTMGSLGLPTIKGRSKGSKEVSQATKRIINTRFTLNKNVWKLAASKPELIVTKAGKQDTLLQALLATLGHLPEEFYFPISFDYRGRMYYRGGMFTPQGADLMKGLLQFAEPAPIGKHGKFALAMAYADAAGFKGTKAECLSWATDINHADHKESRNGSKGFQAYGLRNELDRLAWWVESGLVEAEFDSSIICHMDATCSGLQIASAITGHRPTAEATNCTARTANQGKRDVYGDVSARLVGDAPLAAYAAQYGRAMVKTAVMTLGYGAGDDKLCSTVEEFLAGKGVTIKLVAREEGNFCFTLLLAVMVHA